jgi:ABC-type transporter Mla subunit MlaD
MRSKGSSIAGNPVLIGAATVLVILVAMFLSYNANAGLPFVPTYQLKMEAPSAAALVKGNEVRIGGTRVGAVDTITTRRRSDGTSVALINLKLERAVQPLPKDSTVIIRPKSALGLKYIEITRGTSKQGYQDGDTMPVSASRPTEVEFDEFVNMFDDPTRASMQENLRGFGDAFAGRGSSLNIALGALPPLLRNIQPVARTLSSRRTGLKRFFNELGDAARIVAPAAQTQADLFVNLDRTFAALDVVDRPFIQESISEGRPTLDTAIRSFPIQRPFLRNTQGLFHDLRPGVRALRAGAPDIASALTVGTHTLHRSPALNHRLASLLGELRRFSNNRMVPLGIKRLSQTLETLNPTLQSLAPVQLQCNYITLWFRNVSSLLSEGDVHGTWQRFIIIATPSGPNNEGGPSSAPANGPNSDNYLHSDPFPNTASPGQPKECEAGNEPFRVGRKVIGNVPGKQPARTEGTH